MEDNNIGLFIKNDKVSIRNKIAWLEGDLEYLKMELKKGKHVKTKIRLKERDISILKKRLSEIEK